MTRNRNSFGLESFESRQLLSAPVAGIESIAVPAVAHHAVHIQPLKHAAAAAVIATQSTRWRDELAARRHLDGEALVIDYARIIDGETGSLAPKDDLTLMVLEISVDARPA